MDMPTMDMLSAFSYLLAISARADHESDLLAPLHSRSRFPNLLYKYRGVERGSP
jgi:hypothetical protein